MTCSNAAGGNFMGDSTSLRPIPAVGDVANFTADIVLSYIFTYGTPFTLTSWLNLSAHQDSNCCGGIPGHPPFSADFSHTALLNSVILPADAVLTSASGSAFPAQESAIPEPTSLALLAGAIAVLARIRRLRDR